MHKDAFNNLSLDEKADVLYLVDGFYVEVWYLPNENRIVDITLPTSNQLSLYKTPLNLNSLL